MQNSAQSENVIVSKAISSYHQQANKEIFLCSKSSKIYELILSSTSLWLFWVWDLHFHTANWFEKTFKRFVPNPWTMGLTLGTHNTSHHSSSNLVATAIKRFGKAFFDDKARCFRPNKELFISSKTEGFTWDCCGTWKPYVSILN